MMKKTRFILLALLFVLSTTAFALTAAAEEPTIIAQGNCGAEGDGTNLTWVLTDDGTLTISGEGIMADYLSYVGNLPLPPWYNSCGKIENIVMEEGVTSIGSDAFAWCESLKNVTFPDSLTTIGGSAFFQCSSLESVILPDNMTKLGFGAFWNCFSLRYITIPDGITTLDAWAFGGCDELKSVILPGSIATIDEDAFDTCEIEALYYCGTPEQWSRVSLEGGPRNSLSGVTVHYVVDSGYCGGADDGKHLAWALDTEGVLTFLGSGSMADYEPGRAPWYARRSNITAVVFKGDIQNCGSNAFRDCAALTDVTLPNNLSVFGDAAFYGCSGLTEFTFGYRVTSIGAQAFYGCEGLNAVTMESYTPSVGAAAFCGCTALRDVYFAGTQAHWDRIAMGPENDPLCGADMHYSFNRVDAGFCGAAGNEENVTWALDSSGIMVISGTGAMADYTYDFSLGHCAMPWYAYRESMRFLIVEDGVTTIGKSAFDDCFLTEISLPDTLTQIGADAFLSCRMESISIPETVTSIGDFAFAYNMALKSITVPGSVTTVRCSTFTDCTALESVTILEGVSVIGESAFEHCEMIRSVTLPDSLREIGDYAFSGCWSSITIPNGVTSIGRSALCSSELTSISIPETVTTIMPGAFSTGSTLTSITVAPGNPVYHAAGNCLIETATGTLVRGCVTSVIPDDGSVTQLGEAAFAGCAIADLSLPNTIECIGIAAFKSCWQLTSLEIPNSVTRIEGAAFSQCRVLASITLPDGITSIENYLFGWCPNLTSVTLPAGITSIGTGAFENCEHLTDITIPAGVTRIGVYAFSFCSSLENIVIPSSVTAIESDAFYDCISLTSITIPDGITRVENRTFTHCSALASVTIPSSVAKIGSTAFDGCDSLADVYYAGSEEQWNEISMEDQNTPLTEATIHFNYHEHTPADPVRENEIAATCTEAGGYDEVVYCTKCDYAFSRTHIDVPAPGHAWGEWVVVKQATTDEEGLMRRTCQNDPSHVEEQVIPKLQPQTTAFQQFVETIRAFFQNIIDWFGRLFRW